MEWEVCGSHAHLSRICCSRGGPVGSKGWEGEASRFEGEEGCACVSVPLATGPLTSGG